MSANSTPKTSSAVGVGWTPKFAELDIPTLHQFILDNPLGILITSLPNSEFQSGRQWRKLQPTHIPFFLTEPDLMDSEPQLLGVLRGHMARQSPHSKALIQTVARQSIGEAFEDDIIVPFEGVDLAQIDADQGVLEEEVMILFNGPAASYATPSFYAHTKPENGEVVLISNFSYVQAYGKLKLYCRSKSIASVRFLEKQTTDLTKHGKETLTDFSNSQSWTNLDAQTAFVEHLIRNFMGVEITITRLEGNTKMMPEMKHPRDKLGVLCCFRRCFRTLRTTAGELIASAIEKCSAQDPKVADAREGEDAKKFLGRKVKSKFGWDYTAANPDPALHNKSDHSDDAIVDEGVYVPKWLVGGFVAIQVVSWLMLLKWK